MITVSPEGWRFPEAGEDLAPLLVPLRVLGVLSLFACPGWTQASSRNPIAVGAEFRNTAPGVHYVGSKVCAGCHAGAGKSRR